MLCNRFELSRDIDVLGADLLAGAALDALVGIDDVLVLAFGDSLNGAVVGARAALDASVSDIVSHDISLHYVYFMHTVQ